MNFFLCLSIADIPPPNLMKQGSDNVPFYADVRVILPLIICILLLLASGATAAVCLRHRKKILLLLLA